MPLDRARVTLWSHQSQLEQMVFAMLAGTSHPKQLFAAITPGGGKSLLAMMLLLLVKHHFAEQLCWLVPRVNLMEQAVSTTLNPKNQALCGHALKVRQAGNEHNPSRDSAGYVTSYQGIALDSSRIHCQAFEHKSTILVLDECHHLSTEPGKQWTAAVAPLIERAKLVLFMSGTMHRDDGWPIAFLPYTRTAHGFLLQLPPEHTLTYSRAQAIRDQAIVKTRITYTDAQTIFLDDDQEKRIDSFDDVLESEQSKHLRCVVETEAGLTMIEKAFREWKGHKKIFPDSKFMVIAPNTTTARQKYSLLLQNLAREDIPIADYKEEEARGILKRFREVKSSGRPCYDIVITVNMAYEGLDVPALDHLVLLTAIRTRGWIEQAISRGNRNCPPWKKLMRLYAPDDTPLKAILKDIISEEESAVQDPEDQQEGDPQTPTNGQPGGGDRQRLSMSIASQTGESRQEDLEIGDEISRKDTTIYDQGIAAAGKEGIIQALDIQIILENIPYAENGYRPPEPMPDKSEDQLHEELKDFIEFEVKSRARAHGYHQHTMRSQLKARFGAIDTLSKRELMKQLAYIKATWPLPRDRQQDEAL